MAKKKSGPEKPSKKKASPVKKKEPKKSKKVNSRMNKKNSNLVSMLDKNKALLHKDFPEFLRKNFEYSGKKINT